MSLYHTSRRAFLKGAATLAAVPGLNAQTPKRAAGSASRLAYIASYSSPKGPEGSKGYGGGIYLFDMDPATGKLTQRAVVRNGDNPSWLAFDPKRAFLYSANETDTYQGADSGSVSAYRIQRPGGGLTLVNTQSSGGAGPCHISVHPSGRWLFSANYAGGAIAVLPIRPSGELGPPSDIKKDSGQTGSTHAASAPPGSFAISGHDKPHAHMIQ